MSSLVFSTEKAIEIQLNSNSKRYPDACSACDPSGLTADLAPSAIRLLCFGMVRSALASIESTAQATPKDQRRWPPACRPRWPHTADRGPTEA